MSLSSEDRDLLALYLVPGIGPRLAAALLERFRSVANIQKASLTELQHIPYLSSATAEALKKALASRNVDAELEKMSQKQVHLLRLGNPLYPAALGNVSVPPQFLYVKGQLEAKDSQAIAIVGSRLCTSYGRRIAERLAGDLARAGYTIISGLARGIDGCAHRGALDAGGRTIAVLAGGLSKIYPPEHTELAEQVAASGALITESAMGMEPMAGMFPARNRIISGLSRAVILVEANEKSGALITARHAAEQGREVFAIPGPVDSPASAGTLKLLREGAKLIRDARDLLADLQGVSPLFAETNPEETTTALPSAQPPPNLEPQHLQIWEFLSETRNVDDLGRHVELSTAALSGVLMTLELRKIIRRLPGNLYERY